MTTWYVVAPHTRFSSTTSPPSFSPKKYNERGGFWGGENSNQAKKHHQRRQDYEECLQTYREVNHGKPLTIRGLSQVKRARLTRYDRYLRSTVCCFAANTVRAMETAKELVVRFFFPLPFFSLSFLYFFTFFLHVSPNTHTHTHTHSSVPPASQATAKRTS